MKNYTYSRSIRNSKFIDAYELDRVFSDLYSFLDSMTASDNLQHYVINSSIKTGSYKGQTGYVVANGDGSVSIVPTYKIEDGSHNIFIDVSMINFEGKSGFVYVKDEKLEVSGDSKPFVKVASNYGALTISTSSFEIEETDRDKYVYTFPKEYINISHLTDSLIDHFIGIISNNVIDPPSPISQFETVLEKNIMFDNSNYGRKLLKLEGIKAEDLYQIEPKWYLEAYFETKGEQLLPELEDVLEPVLFTDNEEDYKFISKVFIDHWLDEKTNSINTPILNIKFTGKIEEGYFDGKLRMGTFELTKLPLMMFGRCFYNANYKIYIKKEKQEGLVDVYTSLCGFLNNNIIKTGSICYRNFSSYFKKYFDQKV